MGKDKLYRKHILMAIADIDDYLADTGFDDFASDKLLQDGVMRKLEIIGEASKRLSPEFTTVHADVPWKDICGMRDKLIHDYFGIKLEAVWNTCQEDLLVLKQALEDERPPGAKP